MTYFHPAWLEHQRKRYLRADAYRFATPGTPEAKMPGWLDPSMTRVRWKEAQEKEARAREAAAREEFERKLLRLHREVKKLKLDHELWLLEDKYSPDQPRDELGRWTSGANSVGDAVATGSSAEAESDRQVLSDETPDPIRSGAQYAEAASKRYSVNLREEEGPGHTIRDHVEKSDAELTQKLHEDWRRVRFGRSEIIHYRPAQGSFLSLASANDFVNRTLEDNKETVDRVASGQDREATLEKRFGYVTGKEAFRPRGDAEPYMRNTYAVRMIIDHDLRSERGYRVRTAFPVNELVGRRR